LRKGKLGTASIERFESAAVPKRMKAIRAASKQNGRAARKGMASTTHASERLRDELAVHQAELKAQNEELRQARIALEAGLERYTQLFDFAPTGYACIDAYGTITELNLAAANLLGRARSRLIGNPLTLYVVERDAQSFNAAIAAARADESTGTCEVRLRHVSGERIVVRISARALKAGETLLLALEDVTAQRRLEESRKLAEERLRETDRRKDEFLALLSHELRTPLTVLLMHSEFLHRMQGLPPKAHRSLEVLRRSAHAQARLVDDLLDVSRIITGKMTMTFDSVDLRAIVRATVESFADQAEGAQIRLLARIDSDVPPTSGDASRLQQAISNVISNALKFTPQGGEISVTLSQAAGQARIEIRDTGVGIEPDVLPHIFERFWQADQSMTRSRGGLGLGLSIVQSIAQGHGGRVEAQSEGVGKGSTFVMTFPLRPSSPKTSSPSAEPMHQNSQLAGAHLLVVEDDPGTRETISEALVDAGADVRVAESARAAVRALDEFTPDLLLCDIGMPEEDGCDLLRRVRARGREHGGAVRALAVTAYATPDDRARTRAAGFEGHLVKPFDASQLLTAVSEALARPKA
jgi:PAS domain S-box-containing protein